MISGLRAIGQRSIQVVHSATAYANRRGAPLSALSSFTNLRLSSTQVRDVDFNDGEMAFKSMRFITLLRALVVFRLCRSPWLVKNSQWLIDISYSTFGERMTNTIMRYTFFGHFCAGEDVSDIGQTVDYLAGNGIGSILDYAAESDIREAEEEGRSVEFETPAKLASSRTYSYLDEDLCDKRMETFEKCIRAVHEVSPTGFAAVKLTALGNPKLLERMSTAIVEIKALFEKFDTVGDGYVTKEEFIEGYAKYFVTEGKDDAMAAFDLADTEKDGRLDYAEWSSALVLDNLGAVTSLCKESGPLSQATLDEEEMELVRKMLERAEYLCELAHSLGVRLMIDAEHTYFQPAIDHVISTLARTYNKDRATIFSTYQMYLRDSNDRLLNDILKAERDNIYFACKLVRGAYLTLERSRAEEMGYTDPVHGTIEDTHKAYDSAVKQMIQKVGAGEKKEVMLATHNQASIEKAMAEMNALGLQLGKDAVYFGQLLGMSDHLTFTLGSKGSGSAYKYVPYGNVKEVLPYLIRRAEENSDMLAGSVHESKLIWHELTRRANLRK
jgi:proline dehydrogenase